jgi:hypothetical protein
MFGKKHRNYEITMKTKNSLTVLIVLTVIAGYAHADIFEIGRKRINIPAPYGYSRITSQMDAVYRMSLRMVDPMNDQLAYYISDSEIPTAMAGDMPLLERYFLLKVNKQLKNMVVGKSDFLEFKSVIKRENKELFESIRSQFPGLMEKASEGISKEFDIDFAFKLSQVIPLDPHYESDNTLAYSLYAHFGVSVEGVDEEAILAATATFVNVAGKILFLYCYAPQDHIEWTRSASKTWAEKIMTSNPQPPAGSSGSRGMDWHKVFKKGVVGAIMGGLIGLIVGMFSIFKRKKED